MAERERDKVRHLEMCVKTRLDAAAQDVVGFRLFITKSEDEDGKQLARILMSVQKKLRLAGQVF